MFLPRVALLLVAEHAKNDLGSLLTSNLISDAAYNAALADDFEAFIDIRSRTIDAAVKKLANW